ncbi:MAG: hypothetical protein R3C39_03710 [Dehalococcoidia bacterium]
MLFADEQRQPIREGRIALTFRRWKRAQARAGARHRFPPGGVLVIEDVSTVEAGTIPLEDARRAGFESTTDLLDTVAEVSGQPIEASTPLYRVAFRFEPAVDARQALAEDADLDAETRADLETRLARMDARAADGPWTRATLEAISERPGVVSTHLARSLGRDRQAFKADVRKLKALGLTISLERGYELSPRGRAYLAAQPVPRP